MIFESDFCKINKYKNKFSDLLGLFLVLSLVVCSY